MVSQGFFSGSEKRSKRLAGQKENKVALGGDNLGSFGGVGAVLGVGALGVKGIQSAIEGGKRLKENIERRVNPERDTSFFSPRDEGTLIASSDLSSLRVESPVVRLANVQDYTGEDTQPSYPDEVGNYLQQQKEKEKEQKKDTTYLDSTGNYYDKNPYKTDERGFTTYDHSVGANLIQKKGDDMRFSQPYNRDDKGELTKNYQKEFASFLRSGESYMHSGLPETTIKQLAYREKPKPSIGSFLGFGEKGYMDPVKAGFIRANAKYDFDNYRRDLVKTAAEKSPYGADVEVGPKRFVEGTGYDQYVRNPDFTYTKTGEKYSQLQDTNIPKGEGYFFKDFYKPGEFQTKEDLNRYLSDRGAYMTDMASNFEGGISGRGEESDDLSSMYKSTAGDFKKGEGKGELGSMPSMGITKEGREEARLNRLQKAKEEGENRNILQKVGDFVGDTFNKLTGIDSVESAEAAIANMAQPQGINTGSTVNLSQIGNVSPTVQAARDAVARANLRKSGLHRTVGGQSSQANYGRASQGFGTGTHGKGMPSNPKGFSGYSRKSTPSKSSTSSRSRGQGPGSKSSRSKGGTGTGGSKASSSGSRGQGGGKASRSKGGSFGGSRRSTNRSKSRRRCDIRTKINISPLIESNLVKDNLAELAYFVQEIKK